ncbi:hypothetical protein GCM10014715_19460 [Streptomyces spiralis]|uniref:Uncharacterized protein n=1 Tax=Streptomyces spiralis TaxID=66376 RepID=A0A919DNA2_9ACTN|nr:hypothetical protein GCM10014715_19460 [Streptomyces spiralis]
MRPAVQTVHHPLHLRLGFSPGLGLRLRLRPRHPFGALGHRVASGPRRLFPPGRRALVPAVPALPAPRSAIRTIRTLEVVPDARLAVLGFPAPGLGLRVLGVVRHTARRVRVVGIPFALALGRAVAGR